MHCCFVSLFLATCRSVMWPMGLFFVFLLTIALLKFIYVVDGRSQDQPIILLDDDSKLPEEKEPHLSHSEKGIW